MSVSKSDSSSSLPAPKPGDDSPKKPLDRNGGVWLRPDFAKSKKKKTSRDDQQSLHQGQGGLAIPANHSTKPRASQEIARKLMERGLATEDSAGNWSKGILDFKNKHPENQVSLSQTLEILRQDGDKAAVRKRQTGLLKAPVDKKADDLAQISLNCAGSKEVRLTNLTVKGFRELFSLVVANLLTAVFDKYDDDTAFAKCDELEIGLQNINSTMDKLGFNAEQNRSLADALVIQDEGDAKFCEKKLNLKEEFCKEVKALLTSYPSLNQAALKIEKQMSQKAHADRGESFIAK